MQEPQGRTAHVYHQNTDSGPSAYRRAGALASAQAPAGGKRLTTYKQSTLAASDEVRAQQTHPYLAQVRGQKSANNYQNKKSALGQTIDDLEAQPQPRHINK